MATPSVLQETILSIYLPTVKLLYNQGFSSGHDTEGDEDGTYTMMSSYTGIEG